MLKDSLNIKIYAVNDEFFFRSYKRDENTGFWAHCIVGFKSND